ncbi:U3 snoRNP protein [Nowakowskiella sp. JEL0407]|nr:U3 snoRNP protein [Nowakowskiella sp. JEL0407]
MKPARRDPNPKSKLNPRRKASSESMLTLSSKRSPPPEFLHIIDEANPSLVKAIFRYDSVCDLTLSQLRVKIQLSIQNSAVIPKNSAPFSSDSDTLSVAESDTISSSSIGIVNSSPRLGTANDFKHLKSDDGDKRNTWKRGSTILDKLNIRRNSKAVTSLSTPTAIPNDSESFVSQSMPFLFLNSGLGSNQIKFLEEELFYVNALNVIDRTTAKIYLRFNPRLWNIFIVRNEHDLENPLQFMFNSPLLYPFDDNDSLGSVLDYVQARNQQFIVKLSGVINNVNEDHYQDTVSNPEAMTLAEFLHHSQVTPSADTVYIQIHQKTFSFEWIFRAVEHTPYSIISRISTEIQKISSQSTPAMSKFKQYAMFLSKIVSFIPNAKSTVKNQLTKPPKDSIVLTNWPPPPIPFAEDTLFSSTMNYLPMLLESLAIISNYKMLTDTFLKISIYFLRSLIVGGLEKAAEIEDKFRLDSVDALKEALKELLNVIDTLEKHMQADKNALAREILVRYILQALDGLMDLIDFVDEVKSESKDAKSEKSIEFITNLNLKFSDSILFIKATHVNLTEKHSERQGYSHSEFLQFWHENGFDSVVRPAHFLDSLRIFALTKVPHSTHSSSEAYNVKDIKLSNLKEHLEVEAWKSFSKQIISSIDSKKLGIVLFSDFESWVEERGGIIPGLLSLVNVPASLSAEDIELAELKHWLEPIDMTEELHSHFTRLQDVGNLSIVHGVNIIKSGCMSPNKVLLFHSAGGAGKSTIISSLVKTTPINRKPQNRLDETERLQIGGYFFFNLYSSTFNNPTKLVQTWAYQYATRSPEFRAALYKLMNLKKSSPNLHEQNISDQSLNNAFRVLLIEAFEVMFESRPLPEKFKLLFIVDGLDEILLKKDKVALISLLRVEGVRVPPFVRFLVTDRNEELALAGLGKSGYKELVIDEKVKKDELRQVAEKMLIELLYGGTYGSANVQDGRARRKKKNEDFSLILDAIVSKSDGLILWVILAFEIFSRSENFKGITVDEVNALPRGIDGVLQKFCGTLFSRLTSESAKFDGSKVTLNEDLENQIMQLKVECAKERVDIAEVVRLVGQLPGPDVKPKRRYSTVPGLRSLLGSDENIASKMLNHSSHSLIEGSRSELGRLILLTVNALEEPITITSLAILLERSQDQVGDVVYLLSALSTKFGFGLLTVDPDLETVKISNKVVSNFLLDEEKCSLLHNELEFILYEDPRKRNLIIAMRCIQIMKTDLFKDPCGFGFQVDDASKSAATVVEYGNVDFDAEVLKKVSQILIYACKHLPSHLQKSIGLSNSMVSKRGRQQKQHRRTAKLKKKLEDSKAWCDSSEPLDTMETNDLYQISFYDDEVIDNLDDSESDSDEEIEGNTDTIAALPSMVASPMASTPILFPTIIRTGSSGSVVSNASSYRPRVDLTANGNTELTVLDIYRLHPSLLLNLLDLLTSQKLLYWLEILNLLSSSSGGGFHLALKAIRHLRSKWIPTDEMLDSIISTTNGKSSTNVPSSPFATGMSGSLTFPGRQLGISHQVRKFPIRVSTHTMHNILDSAAHATLIEDFASHKRQVITARQLMYDTERILIELGPFFRRFPLEIYRWTGSFIPEDSVFRKVFFPNLKELSTSEHKPKVKEDSSTLVNVSKGRRIGGWSADLMTLKGHTGPLTVVKGSPTEFKKWITAGEDGVARVWDLESGECTAKFDASWWAHPGEKIPRVITGVAFCPDNTRRVVVVGDDDNVRIWHSETAELICVLVPPKSRRAISNDIPGVTSLQFFSGTSKRLFVTGHRNGIAYVWDSLQGRHVQTLDEGTNSAAIICIAVSKNYGHSCEIACGLEDGTTTVWNPETGVPLRKLIGHTGSVLCLSFSPYEWWRLLSGSSDNDVKIWDAGSGKCLRTLTGHNSPVTHLEFMASVKESSMINLSQPKTAHTVATASTDGELRIWNIQKGECMHVVQAHTGPVTGVIILPVSLECWILTAGDEGVSKLWKLEKDQTENVIHDDEIELDSDEDDETEVTETCQCVHVFSKHYRGITDIALSMDGRRILTGSADHTAKLWDLESVRLAVSKRASPGITPVTHPEKAINTNPVVKLNAPAAKPSIPVEDDGHNDWILFHSIQDVAVKNKTPSLFVTGSMDNTAKVWDAFEMKLIANLKGHSGWVRCAGFSPHDPLLVVTGSADSTAGVWVLPDRSAGDAESGTSQKATCIQVLSGHGGHITCLDFSPVNALRVATGGMDGTIRVWDLGDGTCKSVLKVNDDQPDMLKTILNIRFVPTDGKLILGVGGPDGCIYGWDVETGAITVKLIGHSGPVTTIAFSPKTEEGETLIATGGRDGTARVWKLDGTLMRTFKSPRDSSTITSVEFSPSDETKLITNNAIRIANIYDIKGDSDIPQTTLRGKICGRAFPFNFQHAMKDKVKQYLVVRDGHKVMLWNGENLINAGFVAEDESNDVVLPVVKEQVGEQQESGVFALNFRLWWFKRGKPICFEFTNAHEF